jgi:hypothetical protein
LFIYLYTRVEGEAWRAPDRPRAAIDRPHGSLSTGGLLGILDVSWKLICMEDDKEKMIRINS